jgi:phosphoglycolate phosphatase-like HAD superfamily hydrolase
MAMDKMTEIMSEILPKDLAGRCLPGAHELLEKLAQMDDVHLVIATGTLEKTAKLLLERSGLNRYFPTGAFGSECTSREELVALARDRGMALYELDPSHTRIATIGDAPSDILAGKSIQAFTISVTTSLFDEQALAEYEPDLILDGLGNTDHVLQAMLPESD